MGRNLVIIGLNKPCLKGVEASAQHAEPQTVAALNPKLHGFRAYRV